MQITEIPTESRISPIQDLSFGSFRSACIRRGRLISQFSETLTDSSERMTMLSLLLSDQCPWITVVRGSTEVEIGGSVIDQLEESWRAVSDILGTEGEIDRYPLLAFNEAYLNAICHRDYDNPRPITIDHSDNTLVISSPGGYFRPTDCRDRHCRNPGLTDVLDGLGYKDPRIHGISGLQTVYRRCLFTPYVLFSTDRTETVLPAMIDVGLYDGMRNSITRLVAERRTVSLTELPGLLSARPATVAKVVRMMVEEGVLKETRGIGRRMELSLTDRDRWVREIRESGFYPHSKSLNTLSEYPSMSSTGIPAINAAWAYMI